MTTTSDQITNSKKPKKVVFCMPTVTRPYDCWVKSLEESVPLIEAAGYEHGLAQEVGNPYISVARADMTRRALDQKADIIVYLDHDLSWDPQDLLKLIETEGDVVGGTYRYKCEEVKYMGSLHHNDGFPLVRATDGAFKADMVPAGFLKITKHALVAYARAYPELLYGDPFNYGIDLFNHGAHKGMWWGEDYAFCRRWHELGGDIWTPPDMNINHHGADGTVFKGNLHQFLMAQVVAVTKITTKENENGWNQAGNN